MTRRREGEAGRARRIARQLEFAALSLLIAWQVAALLLGDVTAVIDAVRG